jgi:hypothetical protein
LSETRLISYSYVTRPPTACDPFESQSRLRPNFGQILENIRASKNGLALLHARSGRVWVRRATHTRLIPSTSSQFPTLGGAGFVIEGSRGATSDHMQSFDPVWGEIWQRPFGAMSFRWKSPGRDECATTGLMHGSIFAGLFDHFIGDGKKRGWNLKSHDPCRLQIDDEAKFDPFCTGNSFAFAPRRIWST